MFRSRPSPFYVMDEVEAALDDVNLHRFLELVDEFRDEAQLIIVSHQKRTMEAADCLYGVTMQPGGSSKVVSEKVERAGLTRSGVNHGSYSRTRRRQNETHGRRWNQTRDMAGGREQGHQGDADEPAS